MNLLRGKNLTLTLLLFAIPILICGCKSLGDDPPRERKPHITSERPQAWSFPMKIVVIVLENTNYEMARAQPFFSELAQKGALLTQYFAITRPSQPNYLALVSGSTFGVDNSNQRIDSLHLGDILEQRNRTWKTYAENFPGNCFMD